MKVEVKIDLIEFKEDNLFYYYCPALDLIGYGNNEPEAKESWDLVLNEYLEYASTNKTLVDDLEKHGWTIKNKRFEAPSFTWMLQNNEQLLEVYNDHNFTKTTVSIILPLEPEFA